MTELEFFIEGTGAIEATQELIEIPGVTGIWHPNVGSEPPEENITTTVTVVGITGSVSKVATLMLKWYQRWKKGKKGKQIQKVLLIDPDKPEITFEEAVKETLETMLAQIGM